jgi:hypothetical protein
MHKSVHHVQPSGCVGPLPDSLPAALPPPGQGIPIRALEYKFTVTGPPRAWARRACCCAWRCDGPSPHHSPRTHCGLEVGLRAIRCMIAWSVHRRSQFWSQLSPSIGVRERPASGFASVDEDLWTHLDLGLRIWKAGWVHALAGSNPASSATPTRGNAEADPSGQRS